MARIENGFGIYPGLWSAQCRTRIHIYTKINTPSELDETDLS